MARLDVREDLKQGRPPIGRITDAVALLGPGEALILVTPFEPHPLVAMLRTQGFSHRSRRIADAHWETVFTPDSGGRVAGRAGISEDSPPETPVSGYSEEIVEIDARGLEPPEPMIRILSALDELPEGCVLRGLTERRPIHLLDAIAERGFRAESFEERPHGSWVTLIRHA
jgi:uncharacterized protein (DUF2249 family)